MRLYMRAIQDGQGFLRVAECEDDTDLSYNNQIAIRSAFKSNNTQGAKIEMHLPVLGVIDGGKPDNKTPGYRVDSNPMTT